MHDAEIIDVPVNERPSFQFYPADWLADSRLRACSMQARGLWIDLLCHMHQGDPYGTIDFLDLSLWRGETEAISAPPALARLVGAEEDAVSDALTELLRAGVATIDDRGRLTCRRMVREAQQATSRREHLRTIASSGGQARAKRARRDASGRLVSGQPSSPAIDPAMGRFHQPDPSHKKSGTAGPSPAGDQPNQPPPSPSPSPKTELLLGRPTLSRGRSVPPDLPTRSPAPPASRAGARQPTGGGQRKPGPSPKQRRLKAWRELFTQWWPHVWRKVGKEQARTTWDKVGRKYLSDQLGPHELLGNVRALQEHFERREWSDRPRDKQPHPSSWLNDQAFDDESVAEVIE